jgi:hypothetical protein
LPGLCKNYSEGFKDGIRLDPALFDSFLQCFGFLLCNFILFLGRKCRDNLVLKFPPVLGLFAIILLIVLILLLKAHAIGLKEEIFPPQMLNILEIGFKLLREFFDGEKLLALLSGFELAFRHEFKC